MKKNKKTVAFFNAFYVPHLGGVEIYTNKIVERLKKKYNVIIVSTNFDGNRINNNDDNVKLYYLDSYRLFKDRFPILRFNRKNRKIKKEIKNESIDFVVCNTRYYHTSLLGCKISKKKQAKLLVLDHSSSYVEMGNSIVNFFMKIYENVVTFIIKKYKPSFYGVSKRCNTWLKHFNIEAKGVLYNSIDVSDYSLKENKMNNDMVCFGYVGRVIEAKGILNLIEAFSNLEKKYKNIKLYIAGTGDLLPKLKDNVKSKNIELLGFVEHSKVMELYNKLDVFVHPSMYPEGLPTCILEAGLMNTAIIATDRGGTVEVIPSDEYGIIVEENVEDLQKNMELLIKDKKKLESLKKNIHDRVYNEFNWDVTAKKMMEELEK